MTTHVEHLVHACVVCSDFEKSLAFYTKVLGAEAVDDPFDLDLGGALSRFLDFQGSSACRVVFLRWGEDTTFLELQEYVEPGQNISRSTKDFGLARIALRVDNLNLALEDILAAGIEVRGGPEEFTLPNGLSRRGFSLADPDGTLIELIEYSERTV